VIVNHEADQNSYEVVNEVASIEKQYAKKKKNVVDIRQNFILKML